MPPLITGLECGWVMLPQAVIGCAGERPVTIDVVLLHPARGVALLEAPPNWTPDAPARLRRRLAQARFAAIFPGTLPVLHARLQRGALSGLPQFLAAGFAAEPPLDLPGGDAWMAAVRRALLAPANVPDADRNRMRHGRLIGAAGLLLAGALGGAFLALRPVAPPGMLERLASGVMVPTEALAARPPDVPPGPAVPPPALPVPQETVRVVAAAQPRPALPAPAVAALPAPATPLEARRPPADPAALASLLRRGDALLALGDVFGARRFYERAAEAGSAAGARSVGYTHDPAMLAELGVRGIRPDPLAAAEWYRRADALAVQETR